VPDQLRGALTEFVSFARSLRGDEKGESQTFLDHFFRALGHQGVIEAGATFEFRVAKKPGSAQLELIKGDGASSRAKGGKKFADLLWPDRVLIEMKSRGENLEKHYDQAFDYWTHIVPKRPPFVILSNFDEFWIYDFNTQLFDPVERLKLGELPENIAPFNFLLPIWKKPIFGNNWVDVTRRAADQMATVFREIVDRGEDRERAQRFILQLLVGMVAEDIGLLPEQLLSELLHECADEGASSYDRIGGLFRQMATKQPAPGGRYKGVQYFNGGLFEVVEPIELKRAEAYRLCESAAENWAHVRPEIFGTLFQDSMDKKERHAFGAHFTSEFDIRKVVGPTIVKPWRERIDAAGKNVGDLRKALADLRKFRVLDPACGSGNFLFIAYREMKRLERDILLRLREVSKREPLESAISLHQFFGIDIIPFAVELAKVTLMLAKELELIEAQKLAETDQLLIEEKPLPLDNLDKNIICADALFIEWPKADAIIGNPPFVDARTLTREHGIAYSSKVRANSLKCPVALTSAFIG
jgi:type II restriction/modification system DNA methylase subunit YeeA